MQKIDTIEIKNFKSIRHQKIEGCKRINVFIGYPNVGKSNILEALSLLTFISQRRPVGLTGLIRLEKLTQIFNYSNIQNPAIIELNKKYSVNIKYEDEKGLLFRLIDHNETDVLYNSGRLNMKVGMQQLFSGSTDQIDDFSGRIKELQFFNVKPYKFSEIKTYNAGISALDLNVPFGVNMFEVIANNEEIKKELVDLIKPYNLDLIIDSSSNDIRVSPKIRDGVIYTLPLSLMADTLVRLIFFKTAVYSNKNSILLFEEPEAHMFPPYISKFTNDVMYDENNNQFFITTHSPFVINDFMENLEKEDYAIFAIGYNKENGETIIRKISEDEIHEIYQYGIDLFFNLENYLKDVV